MSKANVKVGRPITSLRTAQAQYQSLKSKRDVAARDFTKFEEYCIQQGLLQKVENPDKAVQVKAHVRRFFDRIWAE
jgi:hypothetical protein